MARKYQCGTKIPGITIVLICAFGVWSANVDKGKSESSSTNQYDHELRQKTSALDSIKTELQKGREKLLELEKQEGNYKSRLDQLEKNISSSKGYITIISLKIDSVEHTIATLQDSLTLSERELKDRQTTLTKRLRGAYMAGPKQDFQILLGSKSPTDAMNRVRYLNDLTRYDKTLAKRIQESRVQIDLRKKNRVQERIRLTALMGTKKQEQTTLVSEEDSHKIMLEKVRNEKKAHMAYIAELEVSQKQLNGIIKLLESKRKKTKTPTIDRKSMVAFEKRRGKLPWPVDGKVAARFGKLVHPVYKTVIMNNGIDITASKGAMVECVAPGTVVHVGFMRGLGNLVIVDHSGGYITVYAHLDNIEVASDTKVENGTVIGRAGDNEIHFEIRKSTESLDPADWLERNAHVSRD